MTCLIKIAYLVLALGTCDALAQEATTAFHTGKSQVANDTGATTAGPDAWVYVSAYIGTSTKTEVHGYIADATGKLTAIPGSPFAADVTLMAVNGLYLFGSDTAGTYWHQG